MIRIGHMLRFFAVPCAAALLLAACHRNEPVVNGNKPMDAAASAFAHEEQAWREKRRSDLLKPEGWTSLIGLHWLDPGSHYIGSDGGNGIHLSMGPGNLGMIEIAGKQVRFVPDKVTASTLDGQPLQAATTLRTDADPAGPSVIGFDGDKGHATVIERIP